MSKDSFRNPTEDGEKKRRLHTKSQWKFPREQTEHRLDFQMHHSLVLHTPSIYLVKQVRFQKTLAVFSLRARGREKEKGGSLHILANTDPLSLVLLASSCHTYYNPGCETPGEARENFP